MKNRWKNSMRTGGILRNIAILCILALVVACCHVPKAERGSGNVISRTETVQNVQRVELRGSGILELVQDGAQQLVIEAEDNVMPHITATIMGDRLVLQRDDSFGTNVRPTRPVRYYLHITELRGIELNGSGNAYATSQLRCDELEIEVNGSGEVELDVAAMALMVDIRGSGEADLRGTADHLVASVSGSGNLDAHHLVAQEAQASVAGSGIMWLYAQSSLEAEVSGSGSIYYTGGAQITRQSISGSGSISKRDFPASPAE